MRLSKKQILKIQKNRDPYLLMDYATKVHPGRSVEGYKILKKNEWFFKVHWPGDPNMPGMLQVEAMVQMSALVILTLPKNKGKIMYISKLKKAIFKQKVLIGDKFNIEADLLAYKRGVATFISRAFIKEKKVCEAEFDLVLPEELNKFRLKIKK